MKNRVRTRLKSRLSVPLVWLRLDDILDPHAPTINFITFMRASAGIGVLYRFYLNRFELHAAPYGYPTWHLLAVVTLLYAVFLAISTSKFRALASPALKASPAFSPQQATHQAPSASAVRMAIIGDCMFFGSFYVLTTDISSDFFLFFLIPIFTGVIFLDFRRNCYV